MSTQEYTCRLTGDKLFSSAFPFVQEDTLIVVRGSMEAGLDAMALHTRPAADSEEFILPVSAVDIIAWAGLQRVELDKPAFVKRWQRYVRSLQNGLSEERSERLAVFSQIFAKKLLRTFDEIEFVATPGADSAGGLAILHYREDALTPYLAILAEGVNDLATTG